MQIIKERNGGGNGEDSGDGGDGVHEGARYLLERVCGLLGGDVPPSAEERIKSVVRAMLRSIRRRLTQVRHAWGMREGPCLSQRHDKRIRGRLPVRLEHHGLQRMIGPLVAAACFHTPVADLTPARHHAAQMGQGTQT